MGKEYRIRIRGEQREDIEVDLMAQLVVMMGRQLAEKASRRPERDTRTEPAAELPAEASDKAPGRAA